MKMKEIWLQGWNFFEDAPFLGIEIEGKQVQGKKIEFGKSHVGERHSFFWNKTPSLLPQQQQLKSTEQV